MRSGLHPKRWLRCAAPPQSKALLMFVVLVAGCATAPRRPPVDLSAPGWTVRQGQAIWKPSADKPEIAGDVVISTHPGGGSYVEFSKTLPVLSGRVYPGGWEFENTAENKRYSGGGNPPKRIAWLQLLRVLEGQEAPDRWRVARASRDFVTLEDPFRGERLELQLQR